MLRTWLIGGAALAAIAVGAPAGRCETPTITHFGNWMAADHVDDLTDKKSYTVGIESTKNPSNTLGKESPAVLRVMCSPDRSLYLTIDWPDFITAVWLGDYHATVAWRLDEGGVQTRNWAMTDNHDGVQLVGDRASAVIATLAAAHRLVVRILGSQGHQTAVFDLDGADQLPSLLASKCNVGLPQLATPAAPSTAGPATGAGLPSPPPLASVPPPSLPLPEPIPTPMVGPPVALETDRTPQAVLAAATGVLAARGFQLDTAAQPAGTIATALKAYPLSPKLADCGRSFGIPYLLDRRASAQLGVIVTAEPGKVSIRTAMGALYRPGLGARDRPLTCKTTLSFEHALADQLKAAL